MLRAADVCWPSKQRGRFAVKLSTSINLYSVVYKSAVDNHCSSSVFKFLSYYRQGATRDGDSSL